MICVSYTRSRIMFGDSISITEQNEKIAEFVKGRRMTIDKKFSDRKEDVDADEGFLEMKEAGINRQFDCIVFWSMMYFGNDPLIGYNLLRHTFIPAGIDIAVVCDNFFSMGRSAEEIEEYLESKYKERRLFHGNNIAKIAAEQRRNTLYGYEKHGEEFEIDEQVAPIVKEIFRQALNGSSVSEICKYFNDKNIECPQIYLRKVAGVSIEKATSHWERNQLKKILTDTRYKGERPTTKKGITTIKYIEPYITADEYEKIQKDFDHRHTQSKSENPFSKMIYDKDTHSKLYMGDYLNNGTSTYYLSQKPKDYKQYKKKVIAVSEVKEEVIKSLNEEIALAKHVYQVMSSTSGKAEINARRENIIKEINSRFEALLDWVSNSVTLDTGLEFGDEIGEADSLLSSIINRKKDFETAFSVSNPWLKLFSELEYIEDISLEISQKFICEVLIDKFESVILVPKHNEWKQLLPSYWLEV